MIDELVSLFNKGEVEQAIEEANRAVAAKPRELPLRLILVQLVCFTGDWLRVEKISKQLAALDHEKEHVALTGFIDSMSAAEEQRRAVWTEGMVPEFVQPPDEVTQKLLWAWSCMRNKDVTQYADSLAWVMEHAADLTLTVGGQSHAGFRDLDDPTCIILEAHTMQGNYVWIPHSLVATVDVARPTRLVDHLWSRARLTLHDGSALVMFLPGTYFHSFDEGAGAPLRMGRATEWGDVDGVEIGRGRRIFAAGDEEFTVFDLNEATLTGAAS